MSLEQAITLTAIPPRLGDDLTLQAAPGKKLQTSVRVRNTSDETLQIKSLVQDFIVDLDGETPVPVSSEISNRWSLASWVTLLPDRQEIEPGEFANLTVLIDIPPDALAGGHYAMITHQPVVGVSSTDAATGTTTDNTGSALQQRVGTLVYVVVEGEINEQAFVRNLEFPKFTEYGPVPFSLVADNQSDVHIQPQIKVEIYNLINKKVDTIELESKNVFPFIERGFDGQWNRLWGFGPYQAKAVMSYGQGQTAIASTNFWLFPFKIAIAATVALLSIIVLLVALSKHFRHRRKRKQTKLNLLKKKINRSASRQTADKQKLDQFDV